MYVLSKSRKLLVKASSAIQEICSVKAGTIFVLLCIFNPHLASAQTDGVISGSISLPESITAPEGGLRISIVALAVSGSGANTRAVSVQIDEDQSSVGYDIDNLNNAGGERWQLRATCSYIAKACRDFVESVFFATNATDNIVFSIQEAEEIGISLEDRNFIIQSGTTFSGMVSIPSGTAPAEELDFTIIVEHESESLRGRLNLSIAEGETSEIYRLTVPPSSSGGYTLSYLCPGPGATSFSQFCNNNYLPSGYFNDAIAGNTAELIDDAQALAGNTSREGINLQFLTGFSITGMVSLTSGTAESEIRLTVRGADQNSDNADARTQLVIEQGNYAASYALNISSDTNAAWRVEYFCAPSDQNCDQFLAAYFDIDDTQDTTSSSILDADTLLGGQSHSAINLQLIETAFEISGMLKLEQEQTAPAGGVTYVVSATGVEGTFIAQTVVIEEDVSFGEFNLAVPGDVTSWALMFSCDRRDQECGGYQERGVLNSLAEGNTSTDFAQVESLPGGQSHTGLMLTLFEAENELCVPILTQNGKIALICL